MKILLSSHFFSPSIGGIEAVSDLLAREFIGAGHDVRVVTQTAGDAGSAQFPFAISRCPSVAELLRLVRWCDVFFHNNLSLRTAWPLLFVNRPWVVAHHTWLARMNGRTGWRDRLKQRVIRRARNIAVSRAIAQHLSSPAVVIGNPYRDDVFRCQSGSVRDRDLIFVGRLVCDKGVDLLLDALALLRRDGIAPRLTVIGGGPERDALVHQCELLGLDSQVTFAGAIRDRELAATIARHRVLVVPSRWREPFGLVALEGIACGCIVLVADCGGLPDAVGPCGETFAHLDVSALAEKIRRLLDPATDLEPFRAAAAAHLAAHSASAVAAKYLRVLEEAVKR